MALKKQRKPSLKKTQGKKKAAGNSRIKEVSGTRWVLHKHTETKKYRGFATRQEAEEFAAATPVQRSVKITAEKAKPAKSKKPAKRATPMPAPQRKKPYTPPTLDVVGLDKLPPAANEGKVRNFLDGKKKFGK